MCVRVLRKIVVDTWIAFGFPSACLLLLKAHHISASNPFHAGKLPYTWTIALRSTASPSVVERLAANDDTPERRHIFKPRYCSQQCIHNIYVYIGVYLNYIIPLRTCFCCCWYFCFMACHFKHCCCGNSSEQL